MSGDLPAWTDHPGHDKVENLTGPSAGPEPFVATWLSNQHTDERPLRILDVGAGRGGFVAWLCKQGYDAYGVEPNHRYVANSQNYFSEAGLGERIRPVLQHGVYPFDDSWFDIVHSNQVIEHVNDLDLFAREVSRVTRPGGTGVHIFPAKWEPVEGHMLIPLAHWIPKGQARRYWIKAALWLGQSATYFAELSLDDRTEVFWRFSENETFYRTGRAVSRALSRYGLSCDRKALAAEKLRRSHFPGTAAPLFTAFREAYITTAKRSHTGNVERSGE
ncbi:class I SAM-dependent methyltransferase [Mycolicibacterium neoaurum]|uniref:class I SAM-dependent methyltransferase n=1 Tax=Mycolicibacterium neoaurum TaxID=1795 RepID=UPI003B8A5A3D